MTQAVLCSCGKKILSRNIGPSRPSSSLGATLKEKNLLPSGAKSGLCSLVEQNLTFKRSLTFSNDTASTVKVKSKISFGSLKGSGKL